MEFGSRFVLIHFRRIITMDPEIPFFKWLALKAGMWLQRLGGRLEMWADPSTRLRILLEEQRASQRPSSLGDYIS